MTSILTRRITYSSQEALVACDTRCSHAWGMSKRPKKRLSDKQDDWMYLSDAEAGVAPEDPGTREGNYGKPTRDSERMNRWCVRECERCVMSQPRHADMPLALRDFDNPEPNIPRRHSHIGPVSCDGCLACERNGQGSACACRCHEET